MKILQNGVQTVDNELKKFHADWMKVSNFAELWNYSNKIERAQ